jgi:hypothetical protein
MINYSIETVNVLKLLLLLPFLISLPLAVPLLSDPESARLRFQRPTNCKNALKMSYKIVHVKES